MVDGSAIMPGAFAPGIPQSRQSGTDADKEKKKC
jgi:hypothetical protein